MSVETLSRPAAHTSSDAPTIVEALDVSRSFQVGGGLFAQGKTLRAVQDVNLSVRRGEVLGIVGESGSGKTTLSRMMLGLMKPTSGEIRIGGQNISQIGRIELSRMLQPIFQDPYSSLNPRKTIGQIIALPLQTHRASTALSRTADVERVMAQVGLPARLLHSYPSQLSGGQRQRVAIARALMIRPDILICDEPTSALDVSVQAQILNLLKDLRAEFNLTYIFITHDLGILEFIADRVAVMYMGRIVEIAPARQLLANPRHPYSKALLGSVLTPDPHLELPDLHLGRGFPDPLNPPGGCHFHPRCPVARPECSTVAPVPTSDPQGMIECHLFNGVAQ